MTRWAEALDLQLSLYEFHASEYGERVSQVMFETVTSDPSAYIWGEPSKVAPKWNEYLRVAAFNAEPVWVDPDMMTVVEAAVDGFLPETLVATDLIAPTGLLVLPRPLYLRDPESDAPVGWRYALWHANDAFDKLILCLYRDPRRAGLPPLPVMTSTWRFGWNLADEADAKGAYMNRGKDGEGTDATAVHRQLQGIWRLLQQHLAETTRERAPRAYRRRVERLEREHVTVVRLRRPRAPVDDDHVPQNVAWTHRWVVGGHWRNQWYPSLGRHRQVWISPYVKGPEELPLVVNKARVFALVR